MQNIIFMLRFNVKMLDIKVCVNLIKVSDFFQKYSLFFFFFFFLSMFVLSGMIFSALQYELLKHSNTHYKSYTQLF